MIVLNGDLGRLGRSQWLAAVVVLVVVLVEFDCGGGSGVCIQVCSS